MTDEQSGENEPVYLTLHDVLGLYGLIVRATAAEAADGWRVAASDPELAEWILGFSTCATPEDVAKPLRSALLSIE
jgi:hypothetical protein